MEQLTMRAVSTPVRVIAYGKWNDLYGGEKVFRKDGTEPEFIAVADATGEVTRLSLSSSVNGERPVELAETHVEGEWRYRDGKPKFTVTGFQPPKAPAKTA